MFSIAVIGGGVSGLSTAYWLNALMPDSRVILYEKASVLGGTIQTARHAGFVVEHGPNGFLDSKPFTLALAERACFEKDLTAAGPASGKRFIYSRGRLRALPGGPLSFLTCPILSPAGRLRVLLEPFISKGRGSDRETIREFGARRLGTEFADRFLDPMAVGIFGGNIAELSIRACFSRIVEMEQAHGSLIQAYIHLMRSRKTTLNAPAQGPGKGRIRTFPEGLAGLISRLEKTLDPRKTEIRKFEAVEEIRGIPGGLAVYSKSGAQEFDAVVSACPAYALSNLVRSGSAEMADLLDAIPYAPMAVAGLGYPIAALRNRMPGYGFLVPGREKRKILGALFSSNLFAGRSPRGHGLIRVMAGGRRNPKIPAMPEKDITDLAAGELSDMLGIHESPVFSRCIRYERAIPQYISGHLERTRRLEQVSSRDFPGLVLAGNAFYGVGVNDCTRRAREAAEMLKKRQEESICQ